MWNISFNVKDKNVNMIVIFYSGGVVVVIDEYKIKEVYDKNGKTIQEVLLDIFKSYCKTNIEKQY